MAEENELSEREREILRLVATGASNKEIARTLVISPNTVKVHLRNIFAKVGVASRTEATLYAIRTGLLPAPAGAAPGLTVPEGEEDEESELESGPALGNEPEQTAGEDIPHRASRRGLIFSALLLSLIALAVISWFFLSQPVQPQPATAQPAPAKLPARWSSLPALPESVQDLAGAVYAGQIYVTGGESAAGVSARTWRYDPKAKTWSPCADKPTPVSQSGAVLLGEKIYVPGGKGANNQPVKTLEIFDPRAGRWEQGAPLPEARSAYALAALEGRLYLFGGWDGQKVTDSVYMYDPQQDRWEQRADMPAARSFAGAAAVGGKILVLGGWDGRSALDRADAYYPSRDQLEETAWETMPALPQPRFAAGTAAIADVVYLVGGEGGPGSAALSPVDLSAQTGQWSSFEQPPAPVGAHVLLLPLDTHLHVLDSAGHQAYQAIYNLAFPVIQ